MQGSATYGPPRKIIRPAAPLQIVVTAVQEKYQMELAELQCSNELKLKFYVEGVSLVDFYKNILNAKNIPTLLIMTKR